MGWRPYMRFFFQAQLLAIEQALSTFLKDGSLSLYLRQCTTTMLKIVKVRFHIPLPSLLLIYGCVPYPCGFMFMFYIKDGTQSLWQSLIMQKGSGAISSHCNLLLRALILLVFLLIPKPLLNFIKLLEYFPDIGEGSVLSGIWQAYLNWYSINT